MEIKHIVLGLLEGVVWYFFIHYWLDYIAKADSQSVDRIGGAIGFVSSRLRALPVGETFVRVGEPVSVRLRFKRCWRRSIESDWAV